MTSTQDLRVFVEGVDVDPVFTQTCFKRFTQFTPLNNSNYLQTGTDNLTCVLTGHVYQMEGFAVMQGGPPCLHHLPLPSRRAPPVNHWLFLGCPWVSLDLEWFRIDVSMMVIVLVEFAFEECGEIWWNPMDLDGIRVLLSFFSRCPQLVGVYEKKIDSSAVPPKTQWHSTVPPAFHTCSGSWAATSHVYGSAWITPTHWDVCARPQGLKASARVRQYRVVLEALRPPQEAAEPKLKSWSDDPREPQQGTEMYRNPRYPKHPRWSDLFTAHGTTFRLWMAMV